jgi:hypothetical protein
MCWTIRPSCRSNNQRLTIAGPQGSVPAVVATNPNPKRRTVMLKVNVGLAKKLSKDYNSEGFSINIEGEVTSPVSDAQGVVEEVKQLYDVAEEALAQQIERARSTTAIASHDEERTNGRRAVPENGQRAINGNGQKEEPATNKQIQYLLAIGKRLKLSTASLEKEIGDILGCEIGLYDLTKKQAGVAIDHLAMPAGNSR